MTEEARVPQFVVDAFAALTREQVIEADRKAWLDGALQAKARLFFNIINKGLRVGSLFFNLFSVLCPCLQSRKLHHEG